MQSWTVCIAGTEARQESCQTQANKTWSERGCQGPAKEHQGVSITAAAQQEQGKSWPNDGRYWQPAWQATGSQCCSATGRSRGRQATALHEETVLQTGHCHCCSASAACAIVLGCHWQPCQTPAGVCPVAGHSKCSGRLDVPMLLTPCCPCRICIIAGDISPIDVVIHLPVMCEDRDIPYIYVPSKDVSQPQECQLCLAPSHVWFGPSRTEDAHVLCMSADAVHSRAAPAGVQSPAASLSALLSRRSWDF